MVGGCGGEASGEDAGFMEMPRCEDGRRHAHARTAARSDFFSSSSIVPVLSVAGSERLCEQEGGTVRTVM